MRMIRYNYIAQHPQPQHQHLLVKISHRRVWCASGSANTRSDCHTVPTVVQTDQWLLMLTFIRLYWSSCIDIDTSMHQPTTSRGKVSIILKSIMTECMQHTASHDSRLGFFRFIFFAHLLTHWNSVLSQNTCRAPNTQLLAPASGVCCKRSLVSFDTVVPFSCHGVWSGQRHVSTKEPEGKEGRGSGWNMFYVFMEMIKWLWNSFLGSKVTNICIVLKWLLLFLDFPVQHLCLILSNW